MEDQISRRRLMQAAIAATVFAGHSTATFRNARGASTGPVGFALCLGLNEVNPNAYGGHNARLGGCINDCTRMKAIADARGFKKAIPLTNEQANIRDVRNHIKWAAHSLLPGDFFMFTCASHGSQRTDTSSDEPDRKDETLCLWDERWVDDDRLELFARFAKGVRILLVVDACHSASTARLLNAEEDFNEAAVVEKERALPIEGGEVPRNVQIVAEEQTSIETSLATISKSLVAYNERRKNSGKPTAVPRGLDGTGDFGAQFNIPEGGTSPIRALPDELSSYLSQFKNPFPGAEKTRSMKAIQAGVVTLAACQDDESAWDDGKSGLFTNSLNRTWDGGRFTGNYQTFFDAVSEPLKRVGRQHPMKDAFGDTDAFLRQTPFTI